MAFGLIDTTYIDFPPNIDVAYLRSLETRSGLRVADLAQRLDAALGTLNAGVDPVLASILAPPTSSIVARASRQDRFRIEKDDEYTVARPQFVKQRGHMLAIDTKTVGIGFTEDGLNDISLDSFDDNVRAMVDGWEAELRFDVLARLFDPSEISIDDVTTATSPGLAGSGTGDNQFVGTMPNGTVIDPTTYSHYLRDTTANRALVLNSAATILRKWRRGTLDLMGSEAFVAAVVALGEAGGFYAASSALIRQGSGAAEALVDPADYVGVFKATSGDIRIRHGIPDISSDHAVVYRSGGQFSSDNPVVMRYDAQRGQDIIVRTREAFPLANAVSKAKYGFNINNRVGAVAIRIAASGNYTAPTFV